METEKKEWLEYIEEIQQVLKPLNYEIVGFDTQIEQPLTIKLIRILRPE